MGPPSRRRPNLRLTSDAPSPMLPWARANNYDLMRFRIHADSRQRAHASAALTPGRRGGPRWRAECEACGLSKVPPKSFEHILVEPGCDGVPPFHFGTNSSIAIGLCACAVFVSCRLDRRIRFVGSCIVSRKTRHSSIYISRSFCSFVGDNQLGRMVWIVRSV